MDSEWNICFSNDIHLNPGGLCTLKFPRSPLPPQSFFLLSLLLGFPLVIPFFKFEPIALSAGNLLKLCVCVPRMC